MKNHYSAYIARLPTFSPSLQVRVSWLSLGGLLAAMAIFIPEKSDVLAAATIVGLITLIGQRIDYYRYTKLWHQHDRRIRQALNTARTIAWELNPVTGDVLRTGSLADWLGLDSSVSLNTLAESLEWVHPDDRQFIKSTMDKVVVSERERVMEFRMFRVDGSMMRVQTHFRTEGELGQIPDRVYGVHIDITDRKRNDERLRLLESVVVHAHEAVVILEATPLLPLQGRSVIYVNDAFCRMTGYERQEVVGRSLHFLRGPESDQATLETIRDAMDSETPLQVELQNYRKNGSVYWAELSLVPVQTNSDQLSHWVMIQRDISDRKTAEDALRASERAFRRMADAAPAMLWETDATGRLTFLSRGWYEFLGYDPHFIPVDRLSQGVHPEDQDDARRLSQDGIRAQSPYSVEYRLQRPHSGYSWVLESGRPWFDEAGAFLGYMGSIVDINDRKQAEELLRRSEERYRLLFDSVPLPTWVIDRKSTRFLAVNDAAVHLYGYSRMEFLTYTLADIRTAECQNDPVLSVPVYPETIPSPQQHRHHTKDGAILTVEVSVFPLQLDGREVLLALVNNVTDRLRMEEQLRHGQKMEAIGTLAGGIAHDFNNLLTGILGSLSLIRLPTHDPNRQLFDIVERAAQRAADLTGKLLSYARRNQIQAEQIRLLDVIQEVIALFRQSVEPRITIVVDVPPDIPCEIWADPSLLHQVLLNLCLNARDAMPNGGQLTFRVESVHIPATHPERPPTASAGPYWKLSVQDTGMGIPPSVLPRIFEPFFTTKDPGRGTGFGLAMAHGIIAQHKGWIAVSSEPEQGTTFSLFFPQPQPVAGTVRDTPSVPNPHTLPLTAAAPTSVRATILLVDDEDMIRHLGRVVLETAGYRVLEATSGTEAVELYRTSPHAIDLAILDMMMPGLSGLDAARQMTEIAPLRVLFSTGYSADDMSDVLGTQRLLTKPYRPQELQSTVQRVLQDEP